MDTKGLFKKSIKLLVVSSFLSWNLAFAAPEGGSVVQGSAEISQSANQTIINQSSQNAVINWNSFNTASHEAVLFNQPNSSSIALNRITNGLPTQFAGQLNANGQVWILNPAGVLFTSTSRVDVAGLVATTHSITNENFMAGNYKFDLVPGYENAKIINDGLISVKDSGIVALVGPGVENNGVIVANLGKVHLASGSAYTLDMYGDSLINFGSSAPIQNGSVSNSGLIKADGGKVYMTAKSAADILDNVVSMSGVIEANAVSVNQKGEIVLHGDSEGTTVVSGKLSAKGGGHIETSGAHLIIEPSTEIDAGVGGSWLIDPWNITVVAGSGLVNNGGPTAFTPSGTNSQIGANLINTQLGAGTNVTLDTNSGGSDLGNITISSAITWSTAAELKLIANNNIAINAAVNGGASGLVTLQSGAAISQTLAGVITANTLTTSSVTGTTLTTATNIVSNFSATNTTSGNISLTNNSASLSVPSISEQTGGTLTITNTGNIVFPNAYVVTGNTTLTSSAGNIVFNNSVNDLSALGHTLNLSGTVFPTFFSTPGGTTRLGTLSINESAAITVDATLASFILDQLNNGTNISISSSNATGINIATPIVTSSGTASLTFLANGAGALLDIAADVNTGGAQTYRASAAGGTLTLEPGVTIQGGGTISLENRNGNVSGGSNAMNIAGQIGTNANRQAVNLSLSSALNGIDSSLNLISGATIFASSVSAGALGFVITLPAGINWNVTGLLFVRADNISSNGQIHVTGDLGTAPGQIGSIQLQAGLPVPGAGLGNSMVIFDNGIDIYTTSLTAISVRSGTQMIIDTVPNFNIPGTLTLNTWGQASALGEVWIKGTGALGTAPGQIGAISIVGANNYPTPAVQIDAGAQLYANSLSITSAGASSYVFLNNSTTNAYHIPGAMTVSAVVTRIDGIIGAPADLVGSLAVTGTNTIILNAPTTGIMTSGFQTYTGPVRLNSSETITNSTGTITFSGTVNNCPDSTIGCTSGVGPFNLNVSSTSGGITFNNSIGNLAAVNNITLSSPSGTTYITTANGGSITGASLSVTGSAINFGPALTVTTTGNQTYTGAVSLETFATNNNNVTLNTTGGGSVTFNGTVADSNAGTHGLVITAAGGPAAGIYLNASVTPAVRVLSLTAAEKIHLNGSFIDSFGFAAPPSVAMEFFSPVVVDGPTTLQTHFGNMVFHSTITGTAALTIANVNGQSGFGGELRFDGAIGSPGNPLPALNAQVVAQTGVINVNSSIDVTGNLRLSVWNGFGAGTGTINLNNAMTYNVGGSVSLESNQGTFYFNGPTINAATGISIDGYSILRANTTLTNSTSGNINFLRSLNGDGVSPRSLTTTDVGGGSTIFGGIVGGSVPLSFIDVTGPVAINTTGVTTSGLQIYRGAATLGATTTLTSQAAGITFNSTLNGGGGLTTSVINGQSVTFNGAVGGTTALASLITSATGTTYINGGQVRTSSGAQTYNNQVYISADTTLGGVGTTGPININLALDSFDSTARALTLTTTAMTTLIGNIGNANKLSALTVTNASTINAADIYTTTSQTYSGAVTLGVANINLHTDASGTITFGSTLNGASNLTLNTVSSGIVNFNGAVGATTALTSLTISNSPTININTGTTSIRTVDSQTYSGPVLFNSLAAISFIHTNLTSPRAVTFNSTVRSAVTSTAITITGNLAVGALGSIGIGSPVPVASLLVTGTTLGPNVTTSGSQTYSGAVTLNTDETMISTAGSITFGSTINGDGVLGRNLTVNAATTATFNGAVGGSVPLASITVTAPGNINMNNSLFRTTGDQTYNNAMVIIPFVTHVFNSTVDGDITFNAGLFGNGQNNDLTVNAAGSAIFNNGSIGLNEDGMLTVDITGATGIFATNYSFYGTSIVYMRSPFHVTGNVSVVSKFNGMHFYSSIDGPGSLTTAQTSANFPTYFHGPIGATTPLATLTATVNSTGIPMYFEDVIHVTGATVISTNGPVPSFVYLSATTPVVDTMGSLSMSGSVIYFNNHSITTSGSQNYSNGIINTPALSLYTNTTLQSTGGNITINGAINSCVAGGPATCSGGPFNFTASAPSGTVRFGASVGGVAPINNLTVTGTTLLAPLVVVPVDITTTGNQLYNGAFVLGWPSTLTSTAGNITFGGTVNGGNTLITNVTSPNTLTFSGYVGDSTPLTSLTANGTGSILINAGINIPTNSTIRTSGGQSYSAPITLGANTALVSTGSGALTFASINSDGTPRALTLTTGALTTLTGNIGTAISPAGILSALTITGTSNINTATINTTTSQTYSGAVTLSAPTINLNTNAAGTITFGNTINGASDLTLNTTSGGAVNFNNIIGGGTALNSLTVSGSPTININTGTTSIRTVNSQIYSGPVVFNSLAAINFIHTNLTAPRAITFNSTVRSAVTQTAITITGNLAVGALGSIGIGSPVPVASLLVTGTTLGPNVTTAGNQNYVGALTLNTNETMTSTGGSITYGSTVDGDGVSPRNLTVNAATTVTFTGAVGNIVPLGALVVTGTTGININGGIVNTVNNQTYNNSVTIGNNLAITAGTSGCSTTNCVQFPLGSGITGPSFNLDIRTFDVTKGGTGAGIAGTVNVNGFTMGGTGGGDISPISQDSVVGGAPSTGAWDNTFIAPGSTGLYCVNGNCTGTLTITATDDNKTYGSVFTPTLYSVIGLSGGDSITSITLTSPVGSPVTATVLGGPYAIIPSNATSQGITNNHYTTINYVNGSLTVNPAPLTVTADNVVKTYGQTTTFTGTEFSITSGMLFNSDTLTSVTLNSSGAAPTANVAGSPYAITPSAAVGSGLSNYTITYDNSGAITVNPAALTINPDSITKTYGTTTPSTTSGFTLLGIQNLETVGTIDIASAGLAPTATVAGSTYPITASNATGGTFDPNNYVITYGTSATITVTPAALSIVPDNITKTYGDTISPTTSLFTPTGLQNGETVGQITLISAGLAPTASVAGSAYTLTGSNATGGTFDPSNYTITYPSTATITVNPAPLTITPDPITKTYGDIISPTTSGFTVDPLTPLQNGETIGTIDISSAGLAGTASVLGGPYPITGSNASGGTFDPNNYAINYLIGGPITVNPAVLTITSLPQTKTEGDFLPLTTTAFTPSGLQNSETVGTVDADSLGLSPSATPGIYPYISVSNAAGGTFDPTNYIINYVIGGNVTVLSGEPQNNFNIPPLLIFDPPFGPGCGARGCDNIDLIMIDPLDGVGIDPIVITVYPEGYLDTTIDGIQPLGSPIGVVISELGDTQAVGEFGTRELGIGTPVFKSDELVAPGASCVCIKTQEKDKKCYSNTESHPEWKSECRAQNVELQNNVYIKNAAAPKHHLLKDVMTMMKLHHPVEQKPAVKNDPKISLEHFPVTKHDMYMR